MAVLYNNLYNKLDDIISVLRSRLGIINIEQDVTVNQTSISTLQTQANNNTNFSVPQGGIIIWSGSATAVPSGWALCNGSNGTPDLRGRFVVGATVPGDTTGATNYNVGDIGGANQHTLTTNEMPSHTHTVTDPGHTHNHAVNTIGRNWRTTFHDGTGTVTGTDNSGGSEPNLLSTDPFALADANTNIAINTTGNGQPHENRPPYYALAYIIKL